MLFQQIYNDRETNYTLNQFKVIMNYEIKYNKHAEKSIKCSHKFLCISVENLIHYNRNKRHCKINE